ncbi:TraI domain-containing protein [Photobacterium sp. GB-72]|uniref:TraI domain-containing protein n=1 Tax=Photobacterium sp. GB-72 TaxID=2022105 RepID=UPI000D176CB1|nr:TraI domain-containing protein [Photobacterium sp. GB-72]PSV27628.1 hypothetical protein C9J40_20040 [Photobacterium sp. GB-72]
MIRKFLSLLSQDSSVDPSDDMGSNDNLSGAVAHSQTALCADDIYSAAPRLQQLRDLIIEERALDKEYAERFYGVVIDRFLEFIQALPASKSDHHSMRYGLALHSLEVALYATRKERGQVFMPGTEDKVALLRDRFTYGVFLSALFHDIAKAFTDLEIVYFDKKEQPIVWNPLTQNIPTGSRYKFRYRNQQNYSLHACLNSIFLPRILNREQLNWLHSSYEVWSIVFGYLSADYENSQLITQIVKYSDGHSVKNSVSTNTGQSQKPPSKLDSVISDIKSVVFNAPKINQVGQPIFVLSTHILLLHPAWCDLLTKDIDERKTQQTRVLNILGETDLIVKSDKRTLNNIEVSQSSQKFGNINKTFWSVILIQRSAIDPDNQLQVGDLVIRPTKQSPLIGYIENVDETITEKSEGNSRAQVPNDTDKAPTNIIEAKKDDKALQEITNTDTENSEGNSRAQVPNDTDKAPTNIIEAKKDDKALQEITNTDSEELTCITNQNIPLANESHEKQLFDSYMNESNKVSSVSCDDSQKDRKDSTNKTDDSHEIMLATSQLHNHPVDLAKLSSNNNIEESQKSDDIPQRHTVNFIDSDISKLFVRFIESCLRDSKLVSVAQAPLHKQNNNLYCVWPKVITLFKHRHERDIRKITGVIDESELRRMILNLNYHDKQRNNVDFVKIAFTLGRSTSGVSISAIKLNQSICCQLNGFEKARPSRSLQLEKD